MENETSYFFYLLDLISWGKGTSTYRFLEMGYLHFIEVFDWVVVR